MKKTTTLISATLGFLLPGLALARMTGWGGNYGRMNQMMGGSWWAGGAMIFGLIIWILIIIGIIYLIRWSVRGGRHWHEWEKKGSAVEILKERYAKGEIKKDEFEEKMKDLTK
jgi:putative membrane protein